MLRIAICVMVIVFPTLLLAADKLPQPGEVRAIVAGTERFLNAYEMGPRSAIQAKIKFFAGDRLECETELSTVTGFAATSSNSTISNITVQGAVRSLLGNFALMDDPQGRHGQDYGEFARAAYGLRIQYDFPDPLETESEVLKQVEKFSYGGLDFYLYSKNADRVELTLYRQDFPAYTLDYSEPGVPVAVRPETEMQQVGWFSASLRPLGHEIFVDKLEPKPVPPSVTSGNNE